MLVWGTVSLEPAEATGLFTGAVGDILFYGGTLILLGTPLAWLKRTLELVLLACLVPCAVIVGILLEGHFSPHDVIDGMPVIVASEADGAVVSHYPDAAIHNATGIPVAITRVLPNFREEIILRKPAKAPGCLQKKRLNPGEKCFVSFSAPSER